MQNTSTFESPSGVSLSALPRRDKLAIWTGLVGVTALAWVYLVVMAIGMADMDMGSSGSMGMGDAASSESMTMGMEDASSESMEMGGGMEGGDSGSMEMGTGGMASDSMGMDMAGKGASGTMAMMQMPQWTPTYVVLMFLMWAVMMVGMMVPTAIPMTLIYAAVAKKAAKQGTPLPSAAMFVSGYVAMWTLFSAVATLAQWGLDEAALLSPMMVSTSPALGGGLLIAAGIYQLTPFKKACLQHCRAPAYFISEHWRPGAGGAFRMGVEHGAFCLGCCWVLMGLLFFGGVMSLFWIAGITLFVLLEKVIPHGILGGRVAGGAMMLAGVGVVGAWI